MQQSPKALGFLLSMVIREGETLKTYSDRYWEMFNEINDDFEDVAIRTFKVGLPTEHDLRKLLTKKPAHNKRQLMDRFGKHKRGEEDQTQGKGKAKVFPERGIFGQEDTIITDLGGIFQSIIRNRQANGQLGV